MAAVVSVGELTLYKDDLRVIRRDISSFLASLRASLERPMRGPTAIPAVEQEELTVGLLMIEEARIRFNAAVQSRDYLTGTEWVAVQNELRGFCGRFLGTEFQSWYFRLAPMASRDRLSGFLGDLSAVRTIGDAMNAFQTYVDSVPLLPFVTSQGSLDLGSLSRIVPKRQQVAPVQFKMVDGRITIDPRAPTIQKADRSNVAAALDQIQGSGDRLIDNLERSNCDKRLIESIKELQSQLTSHSNIIKIGLTNMACTVMSDQFKAELPDAISALLQSHSMSVSLYVAQFPEWEQFTQKAVQVALTDQDIANIDATAQHIVEALSNAPSIADPEVPKTISLVREFLKFPGTSAKRAAFAMIRTIENLLSSILVHAMDFFKKTATKTVDKGSSMAAQVIVGLLGIALVGAVGIGSASLATGTPWVKQAAEIVQKQIETLSK